MHADALGSCTDCHQTWLGVAYATGWGVELEEVQAVQWFTLASQGEDGSPEAQCWLADCYTEGRGVE